MRPNRIKQMLREGKPVLAAIFNIPSPDMVELISIMGYDAVLIDGEHGPINEAMCADMVRAAESRGLGTVVRVPRNEEATILRFLETGPQGIMVPGVNSAEEAAEAVQAARYYPLGKRGLGPGRASDWSVVPDLREYTRQANEQVLLIVQIEDIAAVPNLDEILKVPGVDAVVIGPSDLSKSMGIAGKFDDPRFREVYDLITHKVLAAGIPLGGRPTTDVQGAREEIERGARFIISGVVRIMVNAGREYVKGASAGWK